MLRDGKFVGYPEFELNISFMRFAGSMVLLVGIVFQVVHAEDKPSIMVRLDREARVWQLQAKSVSLPAILGELQRVSGMAIHYSVLPPASVTATCAAEKLPALLKCLLGESSGLVFGQADAAEPKEVWILGSTAAGQASDCPAVAAAVPQTPSTRQDNAELYAGVQSADPRRRAEALYALAANDDKEAEAMLRDAMSDASALVRGQAIGGWVRRHGAEAAEGELQQAMSDVDAAVRMQAIELTDSPDLLSQGLHDSDAMVRQLAKAKLDELVH